MSAACFGPLQRPLAAAFCSGPSIASCTDPQQFGCGLALIDSTGQQVVAAKIVVIIGLLILLSGSLDEEVDLLLLGLLFWLRHSPGQDGSLGLGPGQHPIDWRGWLI